MSMTDLKWALLIVATIIVLVVAPLFMVLNVHTGTREAGAQAFRAGVPAAANPYIGRDPASAQWWLNGWIAEKNRREAGKEANRE